MKMKSKFVLSISALIVTFLTAVSALAVPLPLSQGYVVFFNTNSSKLIFWAATDDGCTVARGSEAGFFYNSALLGTGISYLVCPSSPSTAKEHFMLQRSAKNNIGFVNVSFGSCSAVSYSSAYSIQASMGKGQCDVDVTYTSQK